MSTLSPSLPFVNRYALEASLCRQSFYDFVLRFWSELIPDALVPNWHMQVLCDELQTIMMRVIRREPKEYDLIVNVPPGSTKSTIASEMLMPWAWANDPTLRFICGSYSYPLSLDLASRCYQVVTSDKYLSLFPAVRLAKEAMGYMRTTRMGDRFTTSTGGSVTGMHGHTIVIDDPVNPKEALSEVQLKGANEWIRQTLSSRMVNKKVTPIILIMQRLHQADPTAERLAQKGGVPIRHICLPAEDSYPVRPRGLRKFYKSGLFDPVRLPRTILDQAKADMGEYAYAGQYGQSPIPAGGGMFRTALITIHNAAPHMKKLVRYWDKAGTGGKGCYTVGVKMGVDDHGCYWVLDVVRGQWEAFEREKIIRQTAVADGRLACVQCIEQEGGSGGKESAQNTVRNLAGFRVRVDRPTGDKVMRADPLASQVNAGNFKLVRGVWNGEYLAELQFFKYSKFKDQVDASSGAFAMITGLRKAAGGLASFGSR